MSASRDNVQSKSLVTVTLFVIAVLFPILATISIALRFWARRIKRQKWLGDDWMITLGLFMCWVQSTNTFVAAGLGGIGYTKLDQLSASKVFLKCLWIEGFPLTISLATIKISILLMYKRIFSTSSATRFHLACNIMSGILTAWAVAVVFAQLFAGNPISGAFNPLAPHLAYNYQDFALAVAGTSIVFDVMVLCFPLPVIKSLQMQTRRKIFVASIFWLGTFCCVAAAIRFYVLYHTYHSTTAPGGDPRDPYQNATNGFIWAHIEPSCSVIAACLPTYGPFFVGRGYSLGGIFSSLCSFMSFKTRSTPSREEALISDPESSGQDLELKNSHGGWQKLELESNTVEIRGVSRTTSELEIEEDLALPPRIQVKTEFGSNANFV